MLEAYKNVGNRQKEIERMEESGVSAEDAVSLDLASEIWSYDDSKNGVFDGISTGNDSVDNDFKGIKRGDIVIIGGDSGKGKTLITLDWAVHMCWKQNLNVVLFGLEDSKSETYNKVKSLLRGRGIKEIDKHGEFRVCPIEKADVLRFNPKNVLSTIAKYCDFYKADVIVIDMMNQVIKPNKLEDDDLINDFLHKLRDMAIEKKIAIIMPAQVNKASGISKKELNLSRYLPDQHAFTGLLTVVYGVQKAVVITDVAYKQLFPELAPQFIPDPNCIGMKKTRCLGLRVVKVRDGGDTTDNNHTIPGQNIIRITTYNEKFSGRTTKIEDIGFREYDLSKGGD